MVTIGKRVCANGGVLYSVLCKSTDTKPVDGMKNGSDLYEMDTQTVYMFDGETKTWIAQ